MIDNSNPYYNKDCEARAAAIRAEIDKVKDIAKMMENLPATFHRSLIMLMSWRDVTNEQLAEKSLLTSKTIQRMRTDPDHKSDLDTIVAIAIGLRLPPYISNPLIEKAGIKLRICEKALPTRIYSQLSTKIPYVILTNIWQQQATRR